MGIQDRQYYRDEHRIGLQWPSSMVLTLMIVNGCLFLANAFTPHDWLTNAIALRPGDLSHPLGWFRFVTYGFAHSPAAANHIAFNMISLFFFGRYVEARLGKSEFLAFYLLAIGLGGLAWAARLNVAGNAASVLIGASGGVTAVVLLFVFFAPRATVYLGMLFPVPAWILGLILVGSDLLGALRMGGMTAFDVHLVGAAAAAVYFYSRVRLTSWLPGGPTWAGIGAPRRGPRGSASHRPWWKWFASRPKLRLLDPQQDEPSPPQSTANDEDGDRVLEKLHRLGEASLTARERNILEAYARRMRQKHR